MPVSNDADTGTVYTVGRPRPTLAFAMAAMATSLVTTAVFVLQIARYGLSPLTLIGLLASLATVVLLAFEIGRKSGKPKGETVTPRANNDAAGFSPDFSAYDFGEFIELKPGQSHPLPPDFCSTDIVVFHHPATQAIEAWITGVPNSAAMIRYDENGAKNSASDPDHIAVSP